MDGCRPERSANDISQQREGLQSHLRDLSRSPIPHLNDSSSVTFIASSLWQGTHPNEPYGCGKTKTALKLSDMYTLLPIRFVSNMTVTTSEPIPLSVVKEQKALLPRDPSFHDVQALSEIRHVDRSDGRGFAGKL